MSKIIKNSKLITNKECPITHEPLIKIINSKNKNVIKLNCKHCFSYDAFIKTFIINNKNKNGYNKCPYCRSTIKNIPIIINKYLKD
uniref:RING-type domain-containing protein n=1 Tax=viral metagenome TaxID=1070528 RepID=A0A6C0B3N9_9ZZZZ